MKKADGASTLRHPSHESASAVLAQAAAGAMAATLGAYFVSGAGAPNGWVRCRERPTYGLSPPSFITLLVARQPS